MIETISIWITLEECPVEIFDVIVDILVLVTILCAHEYVSCKVTSRELAGVDLLTPESLTASIRLTAKSDEVCAVYEDQCVRIHIDRCRESYQTNRQTISCAEVSEFLRVDEVCYETFSGTTAVEEVAPLFETGIVWCTVKDRTIKNCDELIIRELLVLELLAEAEATYNIRSCCAISKLFLPMSITGIIRISGKRCRKEG